MALFCFLRQMEMRELVVPRIQGASAGVTEEDKEREFWGRLMTA